MSEEQKFPLTKKAKAEFVKNYELIFLKVPPHNISDEKLVELVNGNQEKISGNVKTNEQPSQEGIQNEGGEGQINPADEGQEGSKIQLTPEEIEAEKQAVSDLEKAKTAESSKEYFSLFGKQPLEDMTNEQIISANENEKSRLEKTKTKSVAKVDVVDSLEHNEETEMVIQRKKDPSDKRVINKNTFQYLKHDFEEVVKVPKEIQNKK